MSISDCFEFLEVTIRVDDVMSVEHEGAVVRTGDPRMVTTVAFEEFAELVDLGLVTFLIRAAAISCDFIETFGSASLHTYRSAFGLPSCNATRAAPPPGTRRLRPTVPNGIAFDGDRDQEQADTRGGDGKQERPGPRPHQEVEPDTINDCLAEVHYALGKFQC